MKVAVYPGSFDPFTYGHLDILKRATCLFDHIIIGVLENPSKSCLFSPGERVEMIGEVIKDWEENIRVIHFNGLLVDFCKKVGACAIIRGLRAVSDYEYEMQMFSVNSQLSKDVETVFLMSSPRYSFLSSSIAREIAQYGGNINSLVPENVKEMLIEKFPQAGD
ncbi:MAG: pantetheine-phosphate adenylyltransferase [Candidatus Rifleibacteriota bacterium]